MLKARLYWLLLAAAVGGLAAAVVVRVAAPTGTESVAMEPVLVARHEIPARTPVSAAAVTVTEVPAGTRHPLALTDPAAAAGRVTLQAIRAGEQVLQADLAAPDEAGYSAAVPPGKRLIAIAVDEVAAVGYHLRPGDWVDALTTRELNGRAVTCRVAAAVRVWAVGTPTQQEGAGSRSVTLVVAPDQAERLVLDSVEGHGLRLVLRPLPQGGVGADEPEGPAGEC